MGRRAAGGQRRRREVAQQLEEQAARLPRPGGGSGGTRRDWQLRQREQRRQPGRPSGNPLESTVDCNLIHNGALKERPKGTFLFFSFLSVLVISWGSLKSSLAQNEDGETRGAEDNRLSVPSPHAEAAVAVGSHDDIEYGRRESLISTSMVCSRRQSGELRGGKYNTYGAKF